MNILMQLNKVPDGVLMAIWINHLLLHHYSIEKWIKKAK